MVLGSSIFAEVVAAEHSRDLIMACAGIKSLAFATVVDPVLLLMGLGCISCLHFAVVITVAVTQGQGLLFGMARVLFPKVELIALLSLMRPILFGVYKRATPQHMFIGLVLSGLMCGCAGFAHWSFVKARRQSHLVKPSSWFSGLCCSDVRPLCCSLSRVKD